MGFRAVAIYVAFAIVFAGLVDARGQSTAPTTMGREPVPTVPLPAGMTRIFDGKTLDGWSQIPVDSWYVNNGAVSSKGAGRGVLYTNKSYGRYRIIFDIRHVYGNKDHQACVL